LQELQDSRLRYRKEKTTLHSTKKKKLKCEQDRFGKKKSTGNVYKYA